MKRTLWLLTALLFSLSLWAQSGSGNRFAGFVTNRFIDNWEIAAGAGGQLFHNLPSQEGQNLNQGSLTERTSLTFNLAVGKWFTPVMGLRFQFQGLRMTTYDSKEQKNYFSYAYWHGDMLIDLTNIIFGYNENRIYNAVFIAGFGLSHSYRTNTNSTANLYAATFGLQNKFRLSEAWSAILELKSSVMRNSFDFLSQGRGQGLLVDVSVGLLYRLPTKRDFDAVRVRRPFGR